MIKEKISFIEKFSFGTFNGVNNLQIQFLNTFILFYFTNVVGFSAAIAGMLISFGLAWDGVNDPLIASYVDNHRFRKGERFRPYMIYASIPLAIVTILLFSTFPIPYTFKIVYYFGLYILFYSLTTFLRLPMYNMPILSTEDTPQRLSLNVFASGGASIGSILAGVMMWPIVRAFAGLDPSTSDMINPVRGFFLGAVLIGVLIISCSFFYYFNSRERIRPTEDKNRFGIFKSLKILWKNHNFRYNTIFSTFYWICVTLSTAVIVYYTKYVLDNPNLTTPMMGCFAAGSIVALPFVKKLDIKLGRRKAMIVGASLVAFSKIIFILFSHIVFFPMFHSFILGISVPINIVMFSMTRSEVGDIIGYEQNRRIDGMISNLQGLINKIGASMTIFFIGMALDTSGFNSELLVQPDSVNFMIKSLMGWISLVFAALFIWSASRITIEKEFAKLQTLKQANPSEERSGG